MNPSLKARLGTFKGKVDKAIMYRDAIDAAWAVHNHKDSAGAVKVFNRYKGTESEGDFKRQFTHTMRVLKEDMTCD